MRILVAGAGALGSMFGGFLRLAGHEVTLLGRSPHLEAIRGRGLEIDGIWGHRRAEGFSLALAPSEISGPFDLVILGVKSYDVAATARALAGKLASDGAILCVQNGLGHLEAAGAVFGRERVLCAPVLIGATLPAPGIVRVTVYAKPVKIGAPWLAGSAPSARRAAELLAAAGIPSEPTEGILAYLWEKLLYNAALNPLGALLRVPYGALAERAESRWIMDAVIDEGFAVAQAEGADLLWETADASRRRFYQDLLPPTAHHRSSMLQDIERGKPTEIDAINGYVWRRGAELAVETPVNAVLTRLIKLIETPRS